MSDINRLIALNPFQMPNPVDSYVRGQRVGTETRRANEQAMMQRQQAEQARAQQQELSRMLQMGAGIPELARTPGGLEHAKVLSEHQRRQAQSDIGRGQLDVDRDKLGLERDKYGLETRKYGAEQAQKKRDREREQAMPVTKSARSEILKDTIKTRNTLDKEAYGLQQEYNKIMNAHKVATNATDQRTKRAATASILASMVQLSTPGIVQIPELQMYGGGQEWWQAMLSQLTGAKTEDGKPISGEAKNTLETMKAYYDPLEGADIDGLLELAGGLVVGKTGPIRNRYNDAQERAQVLDPRDTGAIFQGAENLGTLFRLQEHLDEISSERPVTKASAQKQQPRARTRTRQEVDQRESAADVPIQDLLDMYK